MHHKKGNDEKNANENNRVIHRIANSHLFVSREASAFHKVSHSLFFFFSSDSTGERTRRVDMCVCVFFFSIFLFASTIACRWS